MQNTSLSFDEIRKENKKLMMKISSTTDPAEKQAAANQLRSNNRDLRAMAAAFDHQNAHPRIEAHKRKNWQQHG